MPSFRKTPTVGLLGLLLIAPSMASAKEGTYLLFEGSAGASSPAYEGASPGAAWGIAFGPTLRWRGSPVRWHLLGNLQVQRSVVADPHFALERTDLASFVSARAILPVAPPLRLFVEGGLGTRQGFRRWAGGALIISVEPLAVVAAGAQLRLARPFSVGLRAGFEPLEPRKTPVDAGRAQPPRASLLITFGTHL